MKTKSTSSHSVHIKCTPQRTCLACRKVRAKRELIRLVRTPNGNIEIDTSGKKAGRGAYLCPVWKCWETGLKTNRLEHTLRSRLTQDDREQLIKYANTQLKGAD
ncbi:RNase P modulator RnpM [Chloroflexota bacterium]